MHQGEDILSWTSAALATFQSNAHVMTLISFMADFRALLTR